eukprot:2732854-Alexandrium_andersonii.AAC.1
MGCRRFGNDMATTKRRSGDTGLFPCATSREERSDRDTHGFCNIVNEVAEITRAGRRAKAAECVLRQTVLGQATR